MIPRQLTPGKLRGLSQCSTSQGVFSILAIDHRQNLRKALNPQAPGQVSDEALIAFKTQVVGSLAQHASAVLTDPQYGVLPALATHALPGGVGLLLALEATGYTGEATQRQSHLLPGWGVAKAKRIGASAVKLLVYYHPDAPTAHDVEVLVQQTAQDCQAQDMAFFLEPLSYSLAPQEAKLTGDELRQVVLETARRLTPLGVDVLKAEFPIDIQQDADENHWRAACRELSEASQVPWVLLSASVDFETYLRQTTAACQGGASGVAVGRAVWKEATQLEGHLRETFLHSTAAVRMARVTALCASLAHPWWEMVSAQSVSTDWYLSY